MFCKLVDNLGGLESLHKISLLFAVDAKNNLHFPRMLGLQVEGPRGVVLSMDQRLLRCRLQRDARLTHLHISVLHKSNIQAINRRVKSDRC